MRWDDADELVKKKMKVKIPLVQFDFVAARDLCNSYATQALERKQRFHPGGDKLQELVGNTSHKVDEV